jgi:hypothetical protein
LPPLEGDGLTDELKSGSWLEKEPFNIWYMAAIIFDSTEK